MLNKKFWKKYFKVYDVLNLLKPYNELLDKIIIELEIKSSDKILDAGAGTGNLSVKIKERGADVIAFDSSAVALEIYREKDINAKIIEGDLTENLPFGNNSFDKICSNNTLYTIEKSKRKEIFREFYRVLKPGGKLVIANLNENFSPIKIYLSHFSESAKQQGILKTFMQAFILAVPTLKMFYYNFLISRENKNGGHSFFSENEQKNILLDQGFKTVNDEILTYSGSAFLVSANK